LENNRKDRENLNALGEYDFSWMSKSSSVLFNDDENIFENMYRCSNFFSSKRGNSGKLYMNNCTN
jgi:hypothetical protein